MDAFVSRAAEGYKLRRGHAQVAADGHIAFAQCSAQLDDQINRRGHKAHHVQAVRLRGQRRGDRLRKIRGGLVVRIRPDHRAAARGKRGVESFVRALAHGVVNVEKRHIPDRRFVQPVVRHRLRLLGAGRVHAEGPRALIRDARHRSGHRHHRQAERVRLGNHQGADAAQRRKADRHIRRRGLQRIQIRQRLGLIALAIHHEGLETQAARTQAMRLVQFVQGQRNRIVLLHPDLRAAARQRQNRPDRQYRPRKKRTARQDQRRRRQQHTDAQDTQPQKTLHLVHPYLLPRPESPTSRTAIRPETTRVLSIGY